MINFNVEYKTDVLNYLSTHLKDEKILVVTMPNLYEIYKDKLDLFAKTLCIDNVDEPYLADLAQKACGFTSILGFGGGMAIDAAKFIAYNQGVKCNLVPSAISVDACFSYPVAIRRDNKVNYVGEIIPECIYIDYDIISKAPISVNRAGIGDLLSIYTGLFDWKLACENGECELDDEIYQKAQSYLDEVIENVDEIKNVTKKGISLILSGYEWVGVTSHKIGHCRFEEGSEHFFAYCLESIDNKHFLHGQLVALGVYIMSELQGKGRGDLVLKLMGDLELSIAPNDVDTSEEKITQALLMLKQYAENEKLAYSVINEKEIDGKFISHVLEKL